jgi:hypothetical protein
MKLTNEKLYAVTTQHSSLEFPQPITKISKPGLRLSNGDRYFSNVEKSWYQS